MILVAHRDGIVAVSQADHAAMCAEFAGAWGNERFGAIRPAGVVRLAAEQHELGWRKWDDAPTLDPASGLPYTVRTLDPAVHLPMQLEGPRELAAQDPYAALLVAKKHASMYAPPTTIGRLLRSRDRAVHAFLQRSAALQEDLRAGLDVSDEELERNWRLVRAFDALSHDLLLDRAPCIRPGVPAAEGAVELRLERCDGGHALDPWPFGPDRVRVHAAGRLLDERFTDEQRMRAALAAAPRITLAYDLVPA